MPCNKMRQKIILLKVNIIQCIHYNAFPCEGGEEVDLYSQCNYITVHHQGKQWIITLHIV